ncbi:hypothetical protein [Vibrio rotiferianus]|uniref:VapA family S-layer protein n=1 Tax=Vibrio rotiferianus TaxID=190895 RepID=UPI0038B39DA8
MLKKTLLAAAVSSIVAMPAMAHTVNVKPGTGVADFVANTLAIQTKQEVLDRTTLDAKVIAQFDNKKDAGAANDELRAGGELVYQLTGDAQFNPEKVADLLTSTVATTFPSIALVASDAADLTDAATNQAALNADDFFKVDTANGQSTIRYILDQNNQRLSLRLADDFATDVVDLGSGAADTAVEDAIVQVTINFNEEKMAQGFKLQSGSIAASAMNIGALQNASYTANPKPTATLFQVKNLFTLTQTDTLPSANGTADATALVAETYTQWDQGATAAIRDVTLWNNSTKQNIQTSELKLSLTGDFSGIAQKGAFLADDKGEATKWSISNGVASVTYSALAGAPDVIPGNDNKEFGAVGGYLGFPLSLPTFNIDKDNTESLEAQKFELKAEVLAGSFTYVPYEYKIGDAFIIVRDGMKFDTVTTGTTSANVIYIRDVSKSLPVEGGKIFVTITEYDAHELENGGKGTDLVTRAVLPTRLPSNGAVTLTPAGIAEALGVESTPSRQARFYFEVETNEGEAAVKKQTADGVDIQTGSIAEVNFTL